MQVDARDFLSVAEKAGAICTFDIESLGLNGDYNSVLCVSIKQINGPMRTFCVEQPGDDRELMRQVRDELERYTCWISYYGKGFDIPMLQARLLKHGEREIEKRHHLDLYWMLRSRVQISRRSLAHYSRWLGLDQQKLDMSPDDWNAVIAAAADPAKLEVELAKMRKRCESDVIETEELFQRSRHLVMNIAK